MNRARRLLRPLEQPDRAVLGDSVLQSTTLEEVAEAEHYHRWLTDLARPHLGEHPIELGSGLGDYAQTWLNAGSRRITVTERDPARLARLRERFSGDDRVDVQDLDVSTSPAGDFSAYVAFNVLEHIPDHVAALRAARGLLRPGGKVLMFVPAFQFAMSDFDRAVGHVRRYTRTSLTAAFDEAGLDVLDLRYVNAPGLLAWVVGMRLLRMTPGNGPLLTLWDGAVVPLARRLESRFAPPFGQSLWAVGTVR